MLKKIFKEIKIKLIEENKLIIKNNILMMLLYRLIKLLVELKEMKMILVL